MTTFYDLKAAVNDGWSIYDRTPTGYIMKKRVDNKWVLGVLELKKPRDTDEQC